VSFSHYSGGVGGYVQATVWRWTQARWP
jgi:hypothetical protein